jgi:hypothetical protein
LTVDGSGKIVVRTETGFMSPNSNIVRSISQLPNMLSGEEHRSSSQDYILSSDGRWLFLLENTAGHPNLVYRIDLATGIATVIGPHAALGVSSSAQTTSNETWITSNGTYIYSVDQKRPIVSRATLSAPAKLTPYITGSKTGLSGPIGSAVGSSGMLCIVQDAASVRCYAAGAHGNVAPTRTIVGSDYGFRQFDDITFGSRNELIIAASDGTGRIGTSTLAFFDLSEPQPHLVRRLQGPQTALRFVNSLTVNRAGNILVLQKDSNLWDAASELLVFGPHQRDDAAPLVVRDPITSLSNAHRMAAAEGGDVAILGSDGVAIFRHAADRPLQAWPTAQDLPARGWDVAFGGGRLIIANEFGVPVSYKIANIGKTITSNGSGTMDLHDPDFISSDRSGRIYTASTAGVVTLLPLDVHAATGFENVHFRTPFGRNLSAFATDGAGHSYFTSTFNDAVLIVDRSGRESILRGPRTQLNHPTGLAVGRDGTLYVANSESSNVLAFAHGTAGNVAPTARIEGPATELVAPQSLAIDIAGRLYVFDGPQGGTGSDTPHYVRVFGPNSQGDVAPLASYRVPAKCWTDSL